MDDTRIKTAARKALMAADPLYYSWAPDRQERFRANMSETASNKVAAVLLHELLDISCAPENASDAWRDLPLSKLDDLNWAKLLTTGIGEDMIFLNESMAENASLLDFNTLHDYDFDSYLFQEAVKKKEFNNYQERDYYALHFSCWARMIINGRFHYATFYSLAGYLTDQLEDQGQDMMQLLIPHEYVHGKNHGKQEKDGFLWDLQVDAGGLEKQLEELESQWHHYLQQRWTQLNQSFTHDTPAAFMNDTSQDGESSQIFIFNNAAALKQVRWRNFLSDCEQIDANFAEIVQHKEQELKKAQSWLEETHLGIVQNFDPTVTKLRRKRKIILAPGVFDDLTHPNDDGSQ